MKVTIEQGNALDFRVDVLALKFAQSLYGVDLAVSERFSEIGIDLSNSFPNISEYKLITSKGCIAANSILFIGVQPLNRFGYEEIRAFGQQVLMALVKEAPTTQHLCLTIHGPGYGLNEVLAFEAELKGLSDAIKKNECPKHLRQITFVELDKDRAELLKSNLSRLLPQEMIRFNEHFEELNKETVLLLVTAIKFATHILSIESSVNEKQKFSRQVFQDTINKTMQHFSHIIANVSKFVDDTNLQSLTETLQENYTRASALNSLSDNQDSTDAQSMLATILTTLNPFQISIEVVWLKCRDYKYGNIGDYCYIIGMGALIASYRFIGQPLPLLKENLEKRIKNSQIQILNEIALKLIPQNDFPWERVPQLLSTEGCEDLWELYQSSLKNT